MYRFRFVSVLLEHGADVNALNQFQQTPLHCAARNGHAAVVAALLAKGADGSVRIFDLRSLEQFAAQLPGLR